MLRENTMLPSIAAQGQRPGILLLRSASTSRTLMHQAQATITRRMSSAILANTCCPTIGDREGAGSTKSSAGHSSTSLPKSPKVLVL